MFKPGSTIRDSKGHAFTVHLTPVSEKGITMYRTREEWLVSAVEALRPMFAEQASDIPAVKVSVGWPGGRGRKNKVIGQCWHPDSAADGAAHIFVSPVLSAPVEVLETLVHELVHAVDRNASGHKGAFTKLAKALGLTGKMTATVASDDLRLVLADMADRLGEYPHGALVGLPTDGADGPKKQGTRMLKIECVEGSGYTVRMTRKWLDEYGTPTCPCHSVRMAEA